MTFIWPSMLLLLFIVPPLASLYVWLQHRRRSLAMSFGNPALQQTSVQHLGARQHIPAVLFLFAITTLIIAMARPQTEVSLPRLEGTVILAFDVSGSMAADDMEPTRMEAAKRAAIEFVQNQPTTVRIGVVTFSDGGFTTQPPTDDQAAVMAAIGRLSVQRGTSLARGIEAALNVILVDANPALTLSVGRTGIPVATATPVPDGDFTSAVIVLLTDGENNQDPDPLEYAQIAEDRGVRIHTVGVGSAEGATLEIEGFNIRSRLDEATLQQISELTGGTYYNALTEDDLLTIYDNLDPELVLKPQETEITALLAGVGIIFLIFGGTLSLLWLGRLP